MQDALRSAHVLVGLLCRVVSRVACIEKWKVVRWVERVFAALAAVPIDSIRFYYNIKTRTRPRVSCHPIL